MGKQLTVEIKDIDDRSVSNRSRKKPNLTPSDMSRSRGGHQSHSTEQPSAVLGFLNDTGRFGEAIGSSSARNTSIIVFFTDSHLASCKRIKPSFDALSTEFTFTQFYMSDVNEGDDVAQAYDIETMPTFVVFRNGQEIDRLASGNENTLRDLVRKHL